MDRVMASVDASGKEATKSVKKELMGIAPFCRWTEGEWEKLGGIGWNELQNLHKHLSMLSNYLIRLHIERRVKHSA
jgi:hypothetical protein